MRTIIQKAAEYIEYRVGKKERLAMVLDAGLGGLIDRVEDKVIIPYAEIPGFPVLSVNTHTGALVIGTLNGLDVAILAGRIHYYEDGNPAAMLVPLEVLWELGARSILFLCLASSVQEHIQPADLCLLCDHINWSGVDPLIGDHRAPRFLDLSDAYDVQMTEHIRNAAKTTKTKLHEGVYVWVSGPSAPTPAESKMIGKLGGDVIGMSTVPGVILARKQGFRLAALSLTIDCDSSTCGQELNHENPISEAAVGSENMLNLVDAVVKNIRENP